MRNIFISFLVLFLPAFCYSQRQVNLELTMIDPVNNLSIVENDPFYLNAIITNLGPDTLQLGDEVKVQLFLNNNVVTILNGSIMDSFMRFTQHYLIPHDTFMITSPPSFTNFSGTYNYCAKTTLGINTANPLIDPDSSNNNSCALIHIIPLSVLSVANEGSLRLFPVPFSEILNWELQTTTRQKVISIIDLNGRVLFKELTSKSEGQIRLRGLTKGNYFLRIIDSENNSFTKSIQVN